MKTPRDEAEQMAELAAQLEKELFGGMVGPSHRGGTGVVSASLLKVLKYVQRLPATVNERT